MSDNSGIEGAVTGLAVMAGFLGLAYVFLVVILAVVFIYVILVVLVIAGVVSYGMALYNADSRGKLWLVLMPMIGVGSYLFCNEFFYNALYSALPDNNLPTLYQVLLVLCYFGGFSALIFGFINLFRIDDMGTFGITLTGLLWAWAGVAAAMLKVATDIVS